MAATDQNILWRDRSFAGVQKIITLFLFLTGGCAIYGSILHNSFSYMMAASLVLFVNFITLTFNKKENATVRLASVISLIFFSVSMQIFFHGDVFFHLAPGLSAILFILYLEKWPLLLYLAGIELGYLFGWNEYSAGAGSVYHPFYPLFYVVFVLILLQSLHMIKLLLGYYDVMKEDELEDYRSEYIKSHEIPYLMFIKTISDQMDRQAVNIQDTSSHNIARLYSQKSKLATVLDVSSSMRERFKETFEIVDQTSEIINDTLNMAKKGQENVGKILEMVTKMVKIVDITQKSIHDLNMATRKVEGVIQVIDKIANQTRLLALNASIEAARLKGRESGFLMVANEVKKLATMTQVSVQNITTTVREIKRKTHSVQEIIKQEALESLKGLDIARLGGQSIQYVVSIMDSIKGEVDLILEEFETNRSMAMEITSHFEQIDKFVSENEVRMNELRQKAREMNTQSGHILELIDVENISDAITQQNDRAYMLLNRFALECERIFENAIATGGVTEEDLFNRDYHPLEDEMGKFTAKYDQLFETSIQPKLDEYLGLDEHFIYFYVLDDHGYAPVHNSIYSSELSGDDGLDAKLSRNKRIYQDYPTMTAIRNDDIYLLQCVLGNTGEPIMDMSVTLHFRDRKWGIVRVGYVYE